MFYDAIKNTHGLPHDPFKALVAPRPIGWISTLNEDGVVNLAPYSFFNAVGNDPHIVFFSSVGAKHSASNAETSGEFVCSLATWELRQQMNETSASVAAGVDEMAMTGLEPAPSQVVAPPRVAASPAALECRYLKTLTFPDTEGRPSENKIVFGQVVSIYIDDAVLTDGLVDVKKMRPIARMGYMDYAVIDDVFSITRPDG